MPHVDDGTLHAYLDGQLAPADRHEVERHLGECAVCVARLDEERTLITRAAAILEQVALPRAIRAGTRPETRHGWRAMRLPLAWAATVVIAFVMGRYMEGNGGPVDQHIATATPGPQVSVTPQAPPPVPRVSAAPPRNQPAPTRDELRNEGRRTPAAIAASEAPAALANSDMPAREAAHIPGVPVLRTYASANATVVEQQLAGGTIIRLYEYPPNEAAEDASLAAKAVAPGAAFGAAQAPAAQTRPDMLAKAKSERLARYVGNVRVEIEGAVGSDSLERLLEKVR